MPDNEQLMEVQSEIRAYENLLNQTDYKALKHADGVISDADYKEIAAQRQEWRDKINELQAQEQALSDESKAVAE